MDSILPSTPLGQTIRWLSKGRSFKFPEEQPDFAILPATTPKGRREVPEPKSHEDHNPRKSLDNHHQDQHSRTGTAYDRTVLVSWYSANDQENPQNWPRWVKVMIYFQINLYTFTVYMNSTVFTPAKDKFLASNNVPRSVGSLGVAVVLLGYGIGPLLFSPLSDVPSIGRNLPYIISFVIFVIISVGTAVVTNAPGFIVLRFLQGFFGSPCLATGAASLGDITSLLNLPYGLWFWGFLAGCAPVTAPVISGLCVAAKGWHWSMWLVVWFAIPCLVLLGLLPETSAPTILSRRAKRLRALTGDPAFKSEAEVNRAETSFKIELLNFLVIPWRINAQDPAMLFTTLYTALVYAIFYSFFEMIPLVFQNTYQMTLERASLQFLTAIIAVAVATPLYVGPIHVAVNLPIRRGNLPPPERRLIPGLVASLFMPAGIFLFSWTSNGQYHWIVPSTGFFLVMIAVPILMQCMFGYIAVSYPRYSASLFAMNNFARTSLAFGSIMWSGPLYQNLGVAKGGSVIGALTAGCVVGMYTLYFLGPWLRKRSRFTE